MTHLRVATFNVRNGRSFDGRNSWPFRYKATCSAIENLDADVIGLQEVFAFQQRSLRKHVKGYTFFGDARSGKSWGERCSVMVRPENVTVVNQLTHWFGGVKGERLPGSRFPRIATLCTLNVAGLQTPVQFVNTHLDERSQNNRLKSIDELLGLLNPALPTVIAGDLNAQPNDEVLQKLEAHGFTTTLEGSTAGTAHGFTGIRDGARIDHIVVNSYLEVVQSHISYETNGQLPSDHWPVYADLKLADNELPSE